MVKFVKKTSLSSFDNEGSKEKAINFSFLVREGKPLLSWSWGENDRGCNQSSLFPALKKGKNAWLLETRWISSGHYNWSEGDEIILSYKEGVKMLLENGAFNDIFSLG